MSNRKLVTLRKIKEIKPIVDADRIELARIDGWQTVVKKDEFEVGDVGIYFEVDSVLPEDDRWAFMESSKWRVKSRKFRGALSQGLLLPLDILTETEKHDIADIVGLLDNEDTVLEKALTERVNLSNIFDVEKYVPPSAKEPSNNIKGSFPGFLKKSDQERIQNLADDYERDLRYHPYEITEKLEGTSITIYYNSFIDEFGVCSRNTLLDRSDAPIWNIVDELEYEKKLKDYGKPIALQGELVGPGIQKNIYELDEHQFMVYDVWNIPFHTYELPAKRTRIMRDVFDSDEVATENHVPIISFGSIGAEDDIDELLEYAKGKSNINTDVDREGLVFKSMGNSDISFKVVNNNYLLNQ